MSANDPGVCGAAVDFPSALVEGVPMPLIVQTEGPASGSVFPVGCTTVKFEVFNGLTGQLAGSCSFQVCVEDRAAPLLSCPAHQTVYTDCGQDQGGLLGTEVEFSSPLALDNCCELELTQIIGEPSGSWLTLGNHINVWIAEDEAGNRSFCLQRIDVIPNPLRLASFQIVSSGMLGDASKFT